MIKISNCPNCGNNVDLITKNNTTICRDCGYSWVNISNRNLKSSEIKVIMDSLNHYNYTLNQFNDEEASFPFYAIDNDFIESKGSNRNSLIKINPVNEQSLRQGYVGLNKIKKPSKRPIINYDDNIDLSIFQSERVVSDRSNQEYELYNSNSNIRNPYNNYYQNENYERNSNNQSSSRTQNHHIRNQYFTERDDYDSRKPNTNIRQNTYKHANNYSIEDFNSLNEFAEQNPEEFFKEYEITRLNKDGSIEVQQRVLKNKEFSHENNYDNQQDNRSYENNFDNYNQENFFYGQQSNNEYINNDSNYKYSEIKPNYIRPTLSTRVKKERLTEEQKEYKKQLKERIERSSRTKKEDSEYNEDTFQHLLTYEDYQEKVSINLQEARKEQQNRAKRLRTNRYSIGSYINNKRSEEKKHIRSNEYNSKEYILDDNGESIKNYSEKYVNKNIENLEKFNKNYISNNNYNQIKEEINSRKINHNPHFELKTYEKKERKPKNLKPLADSHHPSSLDSFINGNVDIDDNLLNVDVKKNIFGKNTRLSFFENLQINNDGSIKEDSLGLNQGYNEFFNKTSLYPDIKKYSFKQIVEAIKKRFDKDKMSFNLVILIIIFTLLGTFSHFMTKSASEKINKITKEIDIGKDFARPIPTINDSSKAKGSQGVSDALVIEKFILDKNSDSFINASSNEDKKEILVQQSKQSVASDLSLEELKNNKLADSEIKQNTSNTQSTSFLNKTSNYIQQKASKIFNDVNIKVVSSAWKIDDSGKYFEINMDLNNKSSNKSYVIKTIEIIILDISGNIISKREIHPNKTLTMKESSISTVKIPNAPVLSAKSYVKIKDVIKSP